MKLAISNIAWPIECDASVADILVELDIAGIEVAPTKIWPNPLTATDIEIDAYRDIWNQRGIEIVAAQALLFGRPDLTLFDNADVRRKALNYLRDVVRLCARLGARSLVFGSPKNRRVESREPIAVWNEAVEFFGRLGELATAEGAVVVMEANPPEYGADFVTRAAEALALVRAVNHPGFQLHLDTACMTLAGDDPTQSISEAASELAHFHISEPQLIPIGAGTVDHARFGSLLAKFGYDGWGSIEMKQINPFDVQSIRQAIGLVQADYPI